MTKPLARDPRYRKLAFDADIIELCVRWYITYRLSYRDLVEVMAERGVKVAHSTILGIRLLIEVTHALINSNWCRSDGRATFSQRRSAGVRGQRIGNLVHESG
jgi:hypothetical protein